MVYLDGIKSPGSLDFVVADMDAWMKVCKQPKFFVAVVGVVGSASSRFYAKYISEVNPGQQRGLMVFKKSHGIDRDSDAQRYTEAAKVVVTKLLDMAMPVCSNS